LQVGPSPGHTPEELLMKVATATMRVHHQLCARLMADGCTAEEADRIARSRSLQIKGGLIAQEREANRWKG
ncbi:MAG: hypothetical protein M3418_01555, partial [Gemmatimonadota bacterium]|nr:hypothetical protein [Gemmatimonadota bacterium]